MNQQMDWSTSRGGDRLAGLAGAFLAAEECDDFDDALDDLDTSDWDDGTHTEAGYGYPLGSEADVGHVFESLFRSAHRHAHAGAARALFGSASDQPFFKEGDLS
ncbi:MAG: hypothetical protein ABI794_14635 [Betaproteobacteria bacterium]